MSVFEALQDRLQGVDVTSYSHVPLKTAFSVKATYNLMGKMPPRQLPEIVPPLAAEFVSAFMETA